MTKTDRIYEGVCQRLIENVRIGDRLDLSFDPIADPDAYASGDSDASEHPEWEYEFMTVTGFERESSECIRLDFDGFSCGFPPDHWIGVDGEQVR